MSAPTVSAPAMPKGMALSVAKLLGAYVAPGMIVTLLAQQVIVLPAVLAPVADVLGLGVR